MKQTILTPVRTYGEYTLKLTDIDYYPRMSEETTAFNATLIVTKGSDTRKFSCGNSGKGAMTDVDIWGDDREFMKQLIGLLEATIDEEMEEYAKQQGWSHSKPFYLSIENVVDNMLFDYLEANNL